ncbi:hypothetical protein Syun_031924 [Stephania yunnanensis]|uniref:Uncharacterized protein n=1 Tax=Stephania yunnanensis TaxID=152371 RepID=A0AAP0DZI4_9MAGN
MVALEQSTIQNEEIKLSKAHWHWPSPTSDRDLFRQQQVLPISLSLMAFFVFRSRNLHLPRKRVGIIKCSLPHLVGHSSSRKERFVLLLKSTQLSDVSIEAAQAVKRCSSVKKGGPFSIRVECVTYIDPGVSYGTGTASRSATATGTTDAGGAGSHDARKKQESSKGDGGSPTNAQSKEYEIIIRIAKLEHPQSQKEHSLRTRYEYLLSQKKQIIGCWDSSEVDKKPIYELNRDRGMRPGSSATTKRLIGSAIARI